MNLNTNFTVSVDHRNNPCTVNKNVLRIDPARYDLHAAPDYIFNKKEDREIYENAERRLEKRAITIEPYSPPSERIQAQCPQELLDSLHLNEAKLHQFLFHSLSLITDPVRFVQYLKPIEEALTSELEKKGIAFHAENAPKYLITGKGYYIPGPPPPGYEPKKKGRILDSLLLAREQSQGINQEGTPTYTGAVDKEVSNAFVGKKHVFKEDDQVSTLLLHGKNSHRLFFQALVESLKDSEFAQITPVQLLQLFVGVKITSENKTISLWDYLMDSNKDLIEPLENWRLTLRSVMSSVARLCPPLLNRFIPEPLSDGEFLNDATYHFSCRSPFAFNSLLLCFGKELGLPNLMHCMLDSHWKAASKMANRLSTMDKTSYLIAMEALALNPDGIGDIGKCFPFTLSETSVSMDPKYRKYPNTPFNGTEIKLKLKRGETLTAEELKEDKLELMASNAIFNKLMQDPKNHDLIVDFIKKNPTFARIDSVFYRCLYTLFPMNSPLRISMNIHLEKVIKLEEIKALSYEAKMRIYNYLEFLCNPLAAKMRLIAEAKTYFALEKLYDQKSENERE